MDGATQQQSTGTSTVTPRSYSGEKFNIVTGNTPETEHAGYVNGKKIHGLVAGNGEMLYDLGDDEFPGPVGTEYNKFLIAEGLPEDPRAPGADGSPAKEPPTKREVQAAVNEVADSSSAAAGASVDPIDKPFGTGTQTDGSVVIEPEHVSRLRELLDTARRDLHMGTHWALEEMHELFTHVGL